MILCLAVFAVDRQPRGVALKNLSQLSRVGYIILFWRTRSFVPWGITGRGGRDFFRTQIYFKQLSEGFRNNYTSCSVVDILNHLIVFEMFASTYTVNHYHSKFSISLSLTHTLIVPIRYWLCILLIKKNNKS